MKTTTTFEITYDINVAFNVSEAAFLTGLSVDSKSFSGATILNNVITVTLSAPVPTDYSANDLAIMAGTIKDAIAVETNAGVSGQTLSDGVSPVVTYSAMFDADLNGKIDSMSVVFSENLRTGNSLFFAVADFGISGYSVLSMDSTLQDTVQFVLTELSYFDTDSVATIDFLDPSKFEDLAGNLLVDTTVVADDSASLVITEAYTHDNDGNGELDSISVYFSEPIVNGADGTIDFVLGGTFSGRTLTAVASGVDSVAVFTFNEVGVHNTDSVPTISYSGSANLLDASGNGYNAFNTPFTATDAAAPVVTYSAMFDADLNGKIDSMSVVFSENLRTGNSLFFAVADFGISGYSVLSMDSTLQDTVQFVLTELSYFDTDSVATIDFLDPSKFEDLAGNLLVDTTVVADDSAALVITEAYTHDQDGNGELDSISVYFSEPIVNGADGTIDFVLGDTFLGRTLTAVASGVDSVAVFTFNEVGVHNTDSVPTISYSGSANLLDASGNGYNAFNTPFTTTDAAAPVVTYSAMFDADLNGKIDSMSVVFSENLRTGNSLFFAVADFGISGYSVLSMDSTLQDTVQFVLTELSYFDTDSVATIDFLDPSKFEDLAGNLLVDTTVVADDSAALVITEAYTHDNDGNGELDSISVYFSEPIVNGADGTIDFVLGDTFLGRTLTAVASGVDSVAVFTFNEVGVHNTDSVPTISYSGSANLLDASGNGYNAFNTPFTTTDAAAPVVTYSAMFDADLNGKIDSMSVVFSENLRTGNSLFFAVADFGISGYSVLSMDSTLQDTVQFVLTELSYFDTDSVATIDFLDPSKFEDLAGNLLVDTTVVADDSAALVITEAYTHDNDGNGELDSISVYFSEPIVNGADGTIDFVLGGTFSGRTLTAVASGVDSVAVFTFNEVGVHNTDSVPTISYSGSANLLDASGNGYNAFNTPFTATDAAAPVVTYSAMFDADLNGKIDSMSVVFSENLRTGNSLFFAVADFGISGYSVLSMDSTLQDTVQFVLTELSYFDTDSVATIDFLDPSKFEDLVGNLLVDTTVVADDSAALVITEAYTHDQDGNGELDSISVYFSEPIVNGDDGTIDFVLGDTFLGRTLTAVASGVDSVAVFTFNEVGDYNTDSVPTISYSGSANLLDASGNGYNGFNTPFIPTDSAAPILVFAISLDKDSTGVVESIELEFSEPIDTVIFKANLGDWVISDSRRGTSVAINGFENTVDSINGTNVFGDRYYTLLINPENTDLGTGDLLLDYSSGASVYDSAGLNILPDVSLFSIDDRAAPQILSESRSPAVNSYIDVVFSELISGSGTGGSPSIGDFDLEYDINAFGSGTATDITFGSNITDTNDALLSAPEDTVRISLTQSGSANGNEGVRIFAQNQTSIFDSYPNYLYDSTAFVQMASVLGLGFLQDSVVLTSVTNGPDGAVFFWFTDDVDRESNASDNNDKEIRLYTDDMTDNDEIWFRFIDPDGSISFDSDTIVNMTDFAGAALDGDNNNSLYEGYDRVRFNLGSYTGSFSGDETMKIFAFDDGDAFNLKIYGTTTGIELPQSDTLFVSFPDKLAPTITQTVAYDTDENGYLDEFVFEFSEPIVDDSVKFADFIIGGYNPIDTVASGLIQNSYDPGGYNDRFLTFSVNIAGTATDTLTVSYTNNGFLADTASNLLLTDVAISVLDSAAAVIYEASTADENSNGHLDAIYVRFTESIDDPGGFGGFSLSDPVRAIAAATLIGGDSIKLDLTESTFYDTDSVPDITLSAGFIQDSAPGAVVTVGVQNFTNTRDFAAPAIANTNSLDLNGDGYTDAIEVEFSEEIQDLDFLDVVNDFTVSSDNFLTSDEIVQFSSRVDSLTGVTTNVSNDRYVRLRWTPINTVGTGQYKLSYVNSLGDITDQSVNQNVFRDTTGIVVVDKASPTILSSVSLDSVSVDGNVETVEFRFSEPVKDSDFILPSIKNFTFSDDGFSTADTASVFSTAVHSITNGVVTNVTDDEYATLIFNPSMVQGTGIIEFKYADPSFGLIHDTLGVAISPVVPANVTDRAAPYFMALNTRTASANTVIDSLFKSGDQIYIYADLGETGLTVRADLSNLNGSFATNQLLTDNGNNTYTFTTTTVNNMDETPGGFHQIPVTVTDANSNSNTISDSLNVYIDYTAPTAVINSSESDSTNLTSIPFTVTFDEEVANFDGSDITLSVGSVSGFDGAANPMFTFNVTGLSGTNELTVNINASVCTDTAGNLNTAATEFSIISDLDPPTVVITRNAVSSGSFTGTNDNAVSYDIAFSEPIVPGDFTIADDITITSAATVGGSNLVNDGDNQNYTLNLTGISGDGDITITIKSAGASPITDFSGNAMAADEGPSDAFTIDNTAPQATVLTIASNNVTNTDRGITGNTITLSLTVNDDLSGLPTVSFTSGAVAIDNSVTVNDLGSMQYSATYVVDAVDTDGAVDFSLSFTDDAGNVVAGALDNGDLTAGTTVTVDNTRPTVVLTRNAVTNGSFSGTNDDAVSFDISFDEDVSGFALSDIVLNLGGATINGVGTNGLAGDNGGFGASISLATDVANSDYTLTVSNVAGDGTLGITLTASAFTDNAGNQMAANATSNNFTLDNTLPTVVITRNAVSSGSFTGTNDNAVSYDIAFSEPIVPGDFTIADDITITSAATVGGSNLVNDGDNQNYTLNLTGISGDGDITITIKSAGASPITDVSGNAMAADEGPSSAITIDNTAPQATVLTIASNNVTNTDRGITGNTITLSLTVNDDLSGLPTVSFTSGAVAIDNSVTVNDLGSMQYSATYVVDAVDTDGAVDFSLSFTDDAGNVVAGALDNGDLTAGTTVTVDNTRPTVVLTRNAVTNGSFSGTNDDAVSFDISFDEDVSGFALSDIVLNLGGATINGVGTNGLAGDNGGFGASISLATDVANSDYTLTVSNVAGDGTLGITLTASAFTDNAGNQMAANATSDNFTLDNTIPTLQAAVKNSNTQIRAEFSEVVLTNGTNPTDFTVVDEDGTAFLVSGQTDGSAGDVYIVLTVADLTNAEGDLLVTYTNANGEIFDPSQNQASTSGAITIDLTMAEVVTLLEDATNTADGDVNGDSKALYRTSGASDPSAEVPVTITPAISGSTITIYRDETLLDPVGVPYTNVTTNIQPTVADLMAEEVIDFSGADDNGVFTFYITETAVNGASSEGPAVKYSLAFLDDITNSANVTTFAESNVTGTTLTISHPATDDLLISGNGLTNFNYNPGGNSSVKFSPIAAGDGAHSIKYRWENNVSGVTATFNALLMTVNKTENVFDTDRQKLTFKKIETSTDLFLFGSDGSPISFDIDGTDDPGKDDFYFLEVYYQENGTSLTGIGELGVSTVAAKGNLVSKLLAYDPDNTLPDTVSNNPTYVMDGAWIFDPSALDSIAGIPSREVDTLKFVSVLSQESDGALIVKDEALVYLYPNPVVSFDHAVTGQKLINDFYCADDGDFRIQASIYTYTGSGGVDSTGYITNGYMLYTSSDGVAPYELLADSTATGSLGVVNTFDPTSVDPGYYQIVYISNPQTVASTIDTGRFEFRVLSVADAPMLDLASNPDLDAISAFDSGTGEYIIEYCGGQTIEDVVVNSTGVSTEFFKWYLDENGNNEVGTSNLTGANDTNLNVLNEFFGGNIPNSRTTVNFWITELSHVGISGANTASFSGCESPLRKVVIEIYAVPSPITIVDNILATATNQTNLGSINLLGEGANVNSSGYLYEYCEVGGSSASLETIVINSGLNSEDLTETYFTIYDSDASTALATFDPSDLDGSNNLNLAELDLLGATGYDPVAATSDTFYISRTDFDNAVGSDPYPFTGCESDLRKFIISVYQIPDAPVDSNFKGGAGITSRQASAVDNELNYYLCFGEEEEFIQLESPGLTGSKYTWYQDDGTGTAPGAALNAEAFNGRLITLDELEDQGVFDDSVSSTYTYWVTQTRNENSSTDFYGCESDPMKILVTVFPDPSTISFDESGVRELEVSYCEGDLGGVGFDITGNANASFGYYSSNAAGTISSSRTSLFGGSIDPDGQVEVTAQSLLLTNAIEGTYYFLIAQTNDIAPNGSSFPGCESEVSDMAYLTVHVYDIPLAPSIVDATMVYCEGDGINDVEVSGETASTFRWYLDNDNDGFPDDALNPLFTETPTGATSVATASNLGLLGASDGVYRFVVSQTQDIAAGVDEFEGCESAYTKFSITLYSVPDAPIANTPAPQCNRDVTSTSTIISYSGIETTAGETVFKWYNEDDVEVQQTTLTNPVLGGQFSVNLEGFVGDTTVYVRQITNIIAGESFAGCISEPTAITLTVAPVPVVSTLANNQRIDVIQACDEQNIILEVTMDNLDVSQASFVWSAGRTAAQAIEIETSTQTDVGVRTRRIEFDPKSVGADGLAAGDNYFEVKVTDNNAPTGLTGCVETAFITTEIGTTPQPKMRWLGITEGNETTFVFGDNNPTQSNNYDIALIELTVPALSQTVTVTNDDIQIQTRDSIGIAGLVFSEAGTYELNLFYQSTSGCVASITRSITILDKITVTDEVSYDFENGTAGWYADSTTVDGFGTRSNTVWELGPESVNYANPTDQSGINSTNYWATGLDAAYASNEDAWVYSPAYDLSAMTQPTIGFDHARELTFTDGVVVQYSTDDGLTWILLGDYTRLTNSASGLEWYNSEELSGAPGLVNFNSRSDGWTTNSAWKFSAHKLPSNFAEVRFRIALGSTAGDKVDNSNNDLHGFAFDNFRIYNKDKYILIEQFSDLGASSQAVSSEIKTRIDTEISSDAIWINYFKGEEDEVSQRNQSDPGARSNFYGVDSTPESLLSGKTAEDGDVVGWSLNSYKARALEGALFEIGDITIGGGSDELVITTSFVSKIDLPAKSEVSFRFAVIEKQITDPDVMAANGGQPLYNVLRKMLPSSAGLTYSGAVTDGQSVFFNGEESVSVSWDISNVYDVNELSVVVFVQVDNVGGTTANELNKLILQAAEKTNAGVGKVVPVLTGLDNRLEDIHNFAVYPNPADKVFKVQFEIAPINGMKWILYDQVGREVITGAVKSGELEIEITSGELPSGIYLIHFFNDQEKWAPQRVMIRR
ncbi:Ig-like domain-containing protein [Marinoscillum sp.]|uniref:Ig-like domain-containing protein n=1 Tax=Marinoscillum sp. TaxID=2024838 RepID=UPI003BAA81F6